LRWNKKINSIKTTIGKMADRSESITECAVNKTCSLWRFIGENMLCTE